MSTLRGWSMIALVGLLVVVGWAVVFLLVYTVAKLAGWWS